MHIIGASIPRSGHHFLIRMVKNILAKDLLYCEFYSQEGCCGQIPCRKQNRRPLTFQKNHDFDFSLPIADDQEYLVQVRDPAPQILSHIEIASTLVKENQHERNYWLSARIQYFWRFHEKWLGKSRTNFMVLDYDDLSVCPAAVLGKFFERYKLDVPVGRIAEAADAVSKNRSIKGKTEAYVSRKIEAKDFLDLQTLAIIESSIIAEVPSLEAKRKLDRVNFTGSHLFWHAKALAALNGNNAGKGYEWARLCAAEAPDNPMYHFTLARVCNRLNLKDETLASIETGLAAAGDVDQFATRLNRLKTNNEPLQQNLGKSEARPIKADILLKKQKQTIGVEPAK